MQEVHELVVPGAVQYLQGGGHGLHSQEESWGKYVFGQFAPASQVLPNK